jgi:hypothetical protein
MRNTRAKHITVGTLLAVVLIAFIVAILALAQSGISDHTKLCSPSLAKIKWIGCTIATHEGLAGGLIAASGALFAAWLAWCAIMKQIEAAEKLATLKEDSTYEAVRVQLDGVIDVLNQYWRVVDASIKTKEWRKNGISLLRSLYPKPNDLHNKIDRDLAKELDPVRRLQFENLMQSLDWFAQMFERGEDDDHDPLFLENVRTMLTHISVYLESFDPNGAKKFSQRKKNKVDHRSIAAHLNPLIEKFERDGNI